MESAAAPSASCIQFYPELIFSMIFVCYECMKRVE